MTEQTARAQIVETGRLLLEKGLVARTWGNISCRLDEEHFLITPSGLSYTETQEEDLPICTLDAKEWSGPRKPSSEKGIHGSAYEVFPDAGFVIHTHQLYASAIAVHMPEDFETTEEEENLLGGIGVADYGLPGTKKLKNAVRRVMEHGAHVVLMEKHGVVIAGKDREEALMRAELLEEICRRNCQGIPTKKTGLPDSKRLLYCVQTEYPWADLVQEDAVLHRANERYVIPAQLDDMAQMIGPVIPVVIKKRRVIMKALKKYNAILVPQVGGIVCGKDPEDTEALKLLLTKAAVTANHTDACGVETSLSAPDVLLMNLVYKKKYSKQKHRK